MKIGKLLGVGTSLGVVVPRHILRELGWFKGDIIVQSVQDGALVLHNPNRHEVSLITTRKALGDGRTSSNSNTV
jgi:antitoxin component of MazEF toxin-antitoxin module